jgi:hypothetical protein
MVAKILAAAARGNTYLYVKLRLALTYSGGVAGGFAGKKEAGVAMLWK